MASETRKKGSPTPIPPMVAAAFFFAVGIVIVVASWTGVFRTAKHYGTFIWVYTFAGLVVLGLGVWALRARRTYVTPVVEDF